MIEKIYKNIKYIGFSFLAIDVLFTILTVLYFSLSPIGIIPAGIWYLIVCIAVIALNIVFAVGLIIIKKIRKY